jgi:hypothetical protein
MYYKEWLTVRRLLTVLAIGLIGLVGLVAFFSAIFSAGTAAGHTHAAASAGMTGFIDFFGTTALFAGGLMATILGTALSKENDGHLEIAWTKPYSRTQYATAVMLVDAAGIAIAVLLGLGAHALIHVILRQPVSLTGGPNMFGDIMRFALFPFAWYAVIVALSARLRGTCSRVQALVWPVALILLGLQEIPLGPVWHAFMGAVNLVNPLTYVQYHGPGLTIIGGSGMTSALTADVALAALTVGGWALATSQWRRLEA